MLCPRSTTALYYGWNTRDVNQLTEQIPYHKIKPSRGLQPLSVAGLLTWRLVNFWWWTLVMYNMEYNDYKPILFLDKVWKISCIWIWSQGIWMLLSGFSLPYRVTIELGTKLPVHAARIVIRSPLLYHPKIRSGPPRCNAMSRPLRTRPITIVHPSKYYIAVATLTYRYGDSWHLRR